MLEIKRAQKSKRLLLIIILRIAFFFRNRVCFLHLLVLPLRCIIQNYHLNQKLIILFGEVSLREKGVYVVQNGKENDGILGKGANERPRGFWVGAQCSLQNRVGDDE